MSMQNPIADMIIRIKNALARQRVQVVMPASTLKTNIANVLKNEGYITDFSTLPGESGKSTLIIDLKYYQGNPVIGFIKQGSRPSLRRYVGYAAIPRFKGGMGTLIMSTSKGVMSGKQARELKQGGEILCYVACEG